jgi:hypothetical protein
VKRHRGAHPRSPDCAIGAFDGRPGADDVCGEGFFDTLFDRVQAIDPATDPERAQ